MVEWVKTHRICSSNPEQIFQNFFQIIFPDSLNTFISRLDIANPGSSSRASSVKFYKIIYRACALLYILSRFDVNLSGCSAESPVNGLEYEDYDRISLQKHSFGRPLSRKCYKLRRIVVLHILPILIFLLCTKCQRTPNIFSYDFRNDISWFLCIANIVYYINTVQIFLFIIINNF